MPKNPALTFDSIAKADWSFDLQRAEQDGQEFHRVIVTSPDGTETTSAGPTADDAITSALATIPQAVREALS